MAQVIQELGYGSQYAALNAAIGENWFPGTTPEVVNYPAGAGLINSLTAPTANKSIAIGQQMLNSDILNAVATGQPVVVAGLSEGTIVIDAEEAYLATAPNAPPSSLVSFVEFANPQRGLADTYLPAGFTIPGLGYTVHDAPVSQYNTAVVYNQYEGWTNPPNRPWHLLADVNAVAGMPTYTYRPSLPRRLRRWRSPLSRTRSGEPRTRTWSPHPPFPC